MNDDRVLDMFEKIHDGQLEIKGEQTAQGMQLSAATARIGKVEEIVGANTSQLTNLVNHVSIQNGRVSKGEKRMEMVEEKLKSISEAEIYQAGKRDGEANILVSRAQWKSVIAIIGGFGTVIGVVAAGVELAVRMLT